jgi:diguanylate cyclase (GGDEF)-like protein
MQLSGRRKMDEVLSAFQEIRQNRHLDLVEFARCILQQLKSVCEPSGSAIMLVEGGKAKTIAHDGMSGYACGIEIRIDTAALGELRNHQEGLQENHIADSLLSGLVPAGREAKSVLCVPVMQGDVVVALIYLDSQHSEAFDQEDLCCADLMAEEFSLAIRRSLIEARVSELSKMDSMVGCFNRAALEDDMKTEIARSRRYEKQFALFFLEIDPLAAGGNEPDSKAMDMLRSYLAGTVRRNIRNIDRIYFYEDKKFVVILPETDKVEAITVASRLIAMVRQGPPRDRDGAMADQGAVVSIGISGYPDDGNFNGELLVAAREALHQAKSEGGNRLCVYGGMAAAVDRPVVE